jgi:hypothetical protein
MNILIFGCGDACNDLLRNYANDQSINVLAFLDNDSSLRGRRLFGIAEVVPPAKAKDYDYERIVVASNVNAEKRAEIFRQLLQCGVDEKKITFHPEIFAVDYNSRSRFFKNFAKFVKHNNIDGEVAECGVGTGETAKYINRYFFDRDLYIFDTFNGYPSASIETDRIISGFNEETLRCEKFKETSVDLVLRKMTFPDKVIVKKGFFPDSTVDVDGIFCMVHLDMTLYQPTLDALNFFWAKLSRRGVILLRDYYAQVLPGPRKAVEAFEEANNLHLIKVPIGDTTSISIVKEKYDE